ncbi:MAG: YfhO family protein [Vicinamibacteria bacterium]
MRRGSLGLLLLALPFAALQLHAAVLGRPLYFRDTTGAWLPLAESFVHCATEGSLPFWDPYAAFGRSLLGDPRAAVLYPFTWLNLLLLPEHYYALYAIVHVAAGVAGTAVLGRFLGLSRVAAAGAAAVFGASGPFLSLVSMWSHLVGAAYVPWVVWAFARAADGPSARRAAIAAVLLALSLVGGSPEMTALAALGTALVLLARPGGLARLFDRPRSAALAGGAVLGLALAAAQLLPTLDVVARSTRSLYSREDALAWSLHPLTVPETIVPARWADWTLTVTEKRDILELHQPFLLSIYLGAGAALLVAAALCRRRRDLAAPLAMVVVAGLLALGRHAPFYQLFVGTLPVVRGFRFPVKALVLVALGWSLLAGIGIDRLREAGRRERAVVGVGAVLLAMGLGAASLFVNGAVGVPGFLGRWLQKPLPPDGMPFAVAAGALACGALAVLRARPLPVVLLLFACLDLTSRHWYLNPTADPKIWRYRPPVVDALAGTGFARTYSIDQRLLPGGYPTGASAAALPPSLVMAIGAQETLLPPLGARWRVFGSFDADIADLGSVFLGQLRDRFLAARPDEQRALLRIAGVRNVIGVRPGTLPEGAETVASIPGVFAEPIRVVRIQGERPRAYVVDGVRVGDGAEALLDPAFAPEREVLVPDGVARPSQGPAGTAAVTRFSCNAVEVAVDAAVPARLVLLDAYDPGWTAAVDGSPAPVTRANVGFRAVEVPAGRHTVAWTYVPRGFRAGLTLSLLAAAACVALLLRRTTRGPAEEAPSTSR